MGRSSTANDGGSLVPADNGARGSRLDIGAAGVEHLFSRLSLSLSPVSVARVQTTNGDGDGDGDGDLVHGEDEGDEEADNEEEEDRMVVWSRRQVLGAYTVEGTRTE